MVATEAQARVNFYLGVCLALVCAAMLILNLTRGDFILSGALGLLVLVVVIDLCAFVKKKRLPISIPMVLFLLGALIVLSVWRAGAEVGFYAFPTLIGAFLVQPGRFAVWYSLGLTIAVAGTVATVGADAPMAIRLGLALLLCLTFLWFAAKRITEAQDQLENSVFLDPLTGCFNRRHLARVSETQDLRNAAL
ncbi:MAG: GGDEF domain-containing protein, partial [Pseudomonadota bacterium]|nr:GGDEF domain-containing protein [Pseudomonadota bacterium]